MKVYSKRTGAPHARSRERHTSQFCQSSQRMSLLSAGNRKGGTQQELRLPTWPRVMVRDVKDCSFGLCASRDRDAGALGMQLCFVGPASPRAKHGAQHEHLYHRSQSLESVLCGSLKDWNAPGAVCVVRVDLVRTWICATKNLISLLNYR